MIVASNTPAPASSCAVPSAPAHATAIVRPVGAEAYIVQHHVSGTVDIKVYLSADGTVTKAIVMRSSGDTFLDGATYDAAIATTYAPEIRDCAPIAGAYVYQTKYFDTTIPSAAPVPTPSAGSTPAPAPTPAATPTPAPSPTPAATATPKPTSYPTVLVTTRPTTVPTTLVTSVPTTIATSYPTTVPTTYATTVPVKP